ncbi:TetR/AcrR family transcriptional regulator [Gordonia sp. NPDC003425]
MRATRSRADNRAAMEAEIRRLGREHLRTQGAAGLSLRAIARDLGVVSSAVYRYVPSRDELLTMLLVEGYTDLADAVDAAADALDSDRHRDRILAGATTMRAWGVDDPSRWALLYGSPVPGYAAPAERTQQPGTRVIARVIVELMGAWSAGQLRKQLPAISPTVAADMDGVIAQFDVELPAEVVASATTLWAVMVGGVSLEVFGQYGPDTFTHPDLLYASQIGAVLSLLFA